MNSLWTLIIIAIIPIGFFLWWRNKKKKQNEPTPVRNKKTSSDNEAWQTVKKYLKQNQEYGKEIISLFAVKKKNLEELSKESKAYKAQYKQQKQQEKQELLELKKTDKNKYKELKRKQRNKREPEIWLLVYTTKNPKTNVVDPERILQAEIVYEKVSKKVTDRRIVFSDQVDYEKEMKWIQPLKDKEEKQKQKQEKANEKKLRKQKQKQKKKD